MEFVKRDQEFELFLSGKKLIYHSPSNPFLFAGIGTAVYAAIHGNFNVSDKLHEKMALEDFVVVQEEETVIVRLSRKGLLSITVAFAMEEDRLVMKFSETTGKVNRIWIRLAAEKEEHIYGCGEQFSYFDLRGQHFPLWTSEQGVGRNKKTLPTFYADQHDGGGGDYFSTYFPQPTFVSSRKYYCHMDASAYMDFDFREDNYHELQAWEVPAAITVETAGTYVELLKKLTGLLGRQPEIPDWVYEGVTIAAQGGTERCLEKLRAAQAKGVPVNAVWAQDWSGKRQTSFGSRVIWNWQWNKKMYPNLDVTIKKLKEEGIRFMVYLNPHQAVEGDLYKEGSEKGFMVKNSAGEDYIYDFGQFYCGTVDLTNPEAFEWYKSVIKREVLDLGIAGWMADFGEYLQTDMVFHNGVPGDRMHNRWPALWAKVCYEAIQEDGKLGEVIFFMRAGYTGSQKYNTMMWAGDQNVDWSIDDGLPSVIPAALSLAMTGYGLHHSDIGGYTTLFDMKRTKELYVRWCEMCMFTPMLRHHEGNRPADNWQFDSDEETLEHLARMTNIFITLAPYMKEAVKANAASGLAVQRPLFLHYEDDPETHNIRYQYLLGRDLLVAPVYEEGKTEWECYLPKDSWVHLWTGKGYTGGKVTIDVPWGKPPVFYRQESKWVELFEKIGKM